MLSVTHRTTLPFLFVAEYANGHIYYQTPHDTSRQSPLKSAFYDIRQSPLTPESLLTRFGLIRMRQSPALILTLDLLTGTFHLNNTLIPIPPHAPRKRELTPLHLIYERRNELDITAQTHTITYRLGWSCETDWIALDLTPHPNPRLERITLHGSHQLNSTGSNSTPGANSELHPTLIG